MQSIAKSDHCLLFASHCYNTCAGTTLCSRSIAAEGAIADCRSGYPQRGSVSDNAGVVEIYPASLTYSRFGLNPAGVGPLLKGAFGDTVLSMATELTGMAAPTQARKS
jgi:hypothetical protein